MFHRFRAFSGVSRGVEGRLSGGLIPVPWISFPMLLGVFSGAVFGLYSVFPTGSLPAGLPEALWHSCRFVLAALLLATSFLGFVFVPVLSAFRGFLLGCGVAAAFQAESFHGLLLAFFSCGIPALFGLSAFLPAASGAMACSRQLLRCFSRGETRPPEISEDFPRQLLAIAVLCLAEAVYTAFLLPAILGRFS